MKKFSSIQKVRIDFWRKKKVVFVDVEADLRLWYLIQKIDTFNYVHVLFFSLSRKQSCQEVLPNIVDDILLLSQACSYKMGILQNGYKFRNGNFQRGQMMCLCLRLTFWMLIGILNI